MEKNIQIFDSQIEQSGTETAGSVVFPLNGSGDRIRSVPPETDSWIEFLAFFGRVSGGNGEFPEGFRRKFMEYCFRNHRPEFSVSNTVPDIDADIRKCLSI